jgi:hypothetical protein
VRRVVSSPDLAQRLAAGARRSFDDHYSLDRSYEALMRVYRAVGAPVDERQAVTA